MQLVAGGGGLCNDHAHTHMTSHHTGDTNPGVNARLYTHSYQWLQSQLNSGSPAQTELLY